MGKSFSEKVYGACLKIPSGKVTTYKEMAIFLKKRKAWRAVGNILGKNRFLVKIPCHRVVKISGEVGGYVLGAKNKIKLLRAEGIRVKNKKVINLSEYLVKAKELMQ